MLFRSGRGCAGILFFSSGYDSAGGQSHCKISVLQNLKDDVILYGEQNPREVINLYLEGIEILDRNAIINEKKRNLEELNQLKNELSENKNALVEKEAEIARLKALLDSK